jgi:hypothetical protein
MVGGVCADAASKLTNSTSMAAPVTSIMPDGAAAPRIVSRGTEKTLDTASF